MVAAPFRSTSAQPDWLANFYALPGPVWLKTGALRDDSWIIETENPAVKRHAAVTLRFDVPIAPGRRLNDPAEWRDLLTAKQFVYLAMCGRQPWIFTAAAMNEAYRGLLAFIRWRIQRGLPGMKDLTAAWFAEFCESLQQGGLEGLVRSEAAVAAVVLDWSERKIRPPSQPSAPNTLSLAAASAAAGFDDVRQLTPAAVRRFAEYGISCGMGVPRSAIRHCRREQKQSYRSASLDRYLRVWARLGQLRDEMLHDPIGHAPFETRASSSRLAARMGTPLGRTRTVPAQQVLHLIDEALRWVLLYADDVKSLSQSLARAVEEGPQSPSTVRRLRLIREAWSTAELVHMDRPQASSRGYSELQHIWLRLLPGACAIVIAAFSARRVEEIRSLRDDSIELVGDEPWLRAYVAKTLRGRERIPASTAVVKAVEVLKWLSASARSPTNRWLFQVRDPSGLSDRTFTPNISSALSAFSAIARVPTLPDGTSWRFSPHQFRRFFAIVYYYRYRDRSLTALSHYLQQNDPDSTRTYITEARVGGLLKMADVARADREQARKAYEREKLRAQDFEAVGLEFRVEVYKGVIEGTEHIGGFGGERLRRDLEQAVSYWRANLEVGEYGATASTLDELIVQFATGRTLEPSGSGHSYCSCTTSREDMAVAACVNEARSRGVEANDRRGPDLRFAYDLACSGCPHNVQLAENRAYWEELLHSAEAACDSCPGTLLAKQMTTRARAAQGHLSRCFGNGASQ